MCSSQRSIHYMPCLCIFAHFTNHKSFGKLTAPMNIISQEVKAPSKFNELTI